MSLSNVLVFPYMVISMSEKVVYDYRSYSCGVFALTADRRFLTKCFDLDLPGDADARRVFMLSKFCFPHKDDDVGEKPTVIQSRRIKFNKHGFVEPF